jgi:hypothetical protein
LYPGPDLTFQIVRIQSLPEYTVFCSIFLRPEIYCKMAYETYLRTDKSTLLCVQGIYNTLVQYNTPKKVTIMPILCSLGSGSGPKRMDSGPTKKARIRPDPDQRY